MTTLNFVGFCPNCVAHRKLTHEQDRYHCGICHHTWAYSTHPHDAILYVAFVSHDDEHNMVPLGIACTVELAGKLCIQHAQENGDIIADIEFEHVPRTADIEFEHVPWDRSNHSRIEGEFLEWTHGNRDNDTFDYYIRPVKLQ